MEKEDIAKDFRLIDPRQQEIERTTSNLYIPALAEMGYKLPLYVLLYNQIRYYEDYGKLKVGYSVAGKEALAEQFGVTVRQIEQAYNHLTNTYHLGNWVVCDENVFRNVKKIWVSNVRQARGTMEDVVKMIENNSHIMREEADNSHNMRAKLSQYESKTLIAGELPSLDDPCPKVRESKRQLKQAGGGPLTVFLRVNPSGRAWKSQRVYSTQEEVDRLESMDPDDYIDFKYWKSPNWVGDDSKAKLKRMKAKLIQPDIPDEDDTVWEEAQKQLWQ